MIKPAGRSYLCDAFAGVFQQPAADFQPVLIQESHRGLFQIPVKEDTAFAAAYVSGPGNVIQGYLFRIAACDKGNHIF